MRSICTYIFVIKIMAVIVMAEDVRSNPNNIDQVWNEYFRPKLLLFLDDLQSDCQKHGREINLTRMELELESCLHPIAKRLLQPFILDKEVIEIQDIRAGIIIIARGETASPKFLENIRLIVVKRICEFVPPLMNCLKPQLQITERCSSNSALERKAVEYSNIVVKAMCKRNGDELIDLLEADDGMNCASSFVSQGAGCFWNNSKAFLDEDGELLELTNELFCSELEHINECMYDSVDVCDDNSTTPIFTSMLDEIKVWVGTECRNKTASSGNRSQTQILILLIFLSQFLFSFVNK